MAGLSLKSLRPTPDQVCVFGNTFAQIQRNFDQAGVAPDLKENARRMLATSAPFLSFISFALSHERKTTACPPRLVAVDSAFRDEFRKIPKGHKPNWTSALQHSRTNILTEAIGLNYTLTHREVAHGWHALLTIGQSEKTFGLYTSICPSNSPALAFSKLFPGSPADTRYPSNYVERQTGQRSGRVHMFLPDAAIRHMKGIAVDGNYITNTSQERPRPIVFTMHSGFFFVYDLGILASWLKTQAAREAYQYKLRVSGHQFEARDQEYGIFKRLKLPRFAKFESGNPAPKPEFKMQRYLATVLNNFAGPRRPDLRFNRERVKTILEKRGLLT